MIGVRSQLVRVKRMLGFTIGPINPQFDRFPRGAAEAWGNGHPMVRATWLNQLKPRYFLIPLTCAWIEFSDPQIFCRKSHV